MLDSFHQIIYGKEDATEEEVWEAVRSSALEPLVKSLPDGLDTLVGERGMKLSGGENNIMLTSNMFHVVSITILENIQAKGSVLV